MGGRPAQVQVFVLVLGPDLGPDLDLTWDLDLSLTTKDVHIINNESIYVIEDISSQDFIIQKKAVDKTSKEYQTSKVSKEYLRSI